MITRRTLLVRSALTTLFTLVFWSRAEEAVANHVICGECTATGASAGNCICETENPPSGRVWCCQMGVRYCVYYDACENIIRSGYEGCIAGNCWIGPGCTQCGNTYDC
jgi:hypothetical protein